MFVCIMLAVPTCISVVAGITMIYNYNLMHSDCMKDYCSNRTTQHIHMHAALPIVIYH